MFDNGTGLDKADHVNEDIQMVYIRLNKVDYAIASIKDNAKSFILGFDAKTLGAYTLKVDIKGKFNYLHLIDKLEGKEIDLLAESKYEFFGSSADDNDRFIVCLDPSTDMENDEFAYLSNGSITVCGEGELQVFDIAGRMISSQYVNGVKTVSRPAQSGVYILRLLGNDVKTQKIVVR